MKESENVKGKEKKEKKEKDNVKEKEENANKNATSNLAKERDWEPKNANERNKNERDKNAKKNARDKERERVVGVPWLNDYQWLESLSLITFLWLVGFFMVLGNLWFKKLPNRRENATYNCENVINDFTYF